jgi:hypothetical protein
MPCLMRLGCDSDNRHSAIALDYECTQRIACAVADGRRTGLELSDYLRLNLDIESRMDFRCLARS